MQTMWQKSANRRVFPSIVLVVFTCCAVVCGDDSDSQLLSASSEAAELEVNSDHSTILSPSTVTTKEFVSLNETAIANNASRDESIEDSSLISINLNNNLTESSNNLEDHDLEETTLLDQGQMDTDADAIFKNSEFTTFNHLSENTLSSDSSVIDENYPVRVQKCCPEGQALYLGNPGEPAICKNYEENFSVNVYWENTTHYWKFANTDSNNVYVNAFDPCKESKYNLDPEVYNDDVFFLLHNTSLYIPSTLEMHNTSQYCIDTIVSCSRIISNTALICTPTTIAESHYIYTTGLCLSTISLICLAIYSTKRNDIAGDSKYCLASFSGTMATSYFFLSILSLNLFSSKVLAILIYYLNIKYIIWLALLCHAVCRYFHSKKDPSYLKWYAIASFTIPILFLIILVSVDYNCNTNLTNSLVKNIFASNLTLNLCLYFVPILLSCLGNVLYLLFTFKQLKLPRNRYTNIKKLIDAFKTKIWDLDHENIAAINKIYLRSMILFSFMFVFILLDLVFYLIPSSGVDEVHFMFADVCFVLRGVFICFIFWRKNWFCQRCKNTVANNISPSQELQKLNGTDPEQPQC